jgi:hypothetical protein
LSLVAGRNGKWKTVKGKLGFEIGSFDFAQDKYLIVENEFGTLRRFPAIVAEMRFRI